MTLGICIVREKSYLSTMKEKNTVEPTKAELEILLVLWQHGPSTVRFVNDTLNEQKRAVQYTSTLKQMQVMVEKGLLNRDESNMKHVYRPVEEENKMKEPWLLDRFLVTPSTTAPPAPCSFRLPGQPEGL